jgi:hypothetical protein
MLTLVAVYAPEGKKGTWFALMASLMNIALSAGGLLTKYLNKIFVVSREVVSDGVVTVAQDYSQLGDLLWVVVVSSFVIPIVAKCLFYLQGRKLPPKLTSTLEQYNQTAKPMQYLLMPPFWLQHPIMCVHHNILPQSAEIIKCQ